MSCTPLPPLHLPCHSPLPSAPHCPPPAPPCPAFSASLPSPCTPPSPAPALACRVEVLGRQVQTLMAARGDISEAHQLAGELFSTAAQAGMQVRGGPAQVRAGRWYVQNPAGPTPLTCYPAPTPLACPCRYHPNWYQQGLHPSPATPLSHPWHAPAGTTLSRSHTLGMPLSVPPYPALLPSPRLHLGSWACLASTCGLGPPHHP